MMIGMKNYATRLFAALLLILLGSASARAEGVALELDLEGALGVATAEYIIGGIEQANAENSPLVIIRMDTPGGLVEPMRDIVQSILASDVPVVTYVSPGGARADSAGTYILLASHIAAMAPTTHLGAATPVSMLGGDDFSPGDNPDEATDDSEAESADGETGADSDSPAAEEDNAPLPGSAMERKVLNDAISYIRGLAEAHGRNADWAEEAVRSAATLTSEEALQENVIDLIAADRTELLAAIDGREVKINNEMATISTEGVVIEKLEPDWRLKFLNTIASPEIAVLLLMVGLYGLLLEGYNPGAMLPGIVGVISLLMAAYALQVFPVNYAGLALILVGVALLVAEAFAPSFGALGLGGTVAIIMGSIMMFDSGIPGFGISISFVVTFAVVMAVTLIWFATYLAKIRARRVVIGSETAAGSIAVATENFVDGEGHVWFESESWAARSKQDIAKEQRVRILGVNGLVLDVESAEPTEPVRRAY